VFGEIVILGSYVNQLPTKELDTLIYNKVGKGQGIIINLSLKLLIGTSIAIFFCQEPQLHFYCLLG